MVDANLFYGAAQPMHHYGRLAGEPLILLFDDARCLPCWIQQGAGRSPQPGAVQKRRIDTDPPSGFESETYALRVLLTRAADLQRPTKV